MKDFVTKLTFAFLMAQLFPGAVAVFALGFTYVALESNVTYISILGAGDELLAAWHAASPAHLLFLLGLCVGAGMLIHGIHWSVLGALEKDNTVSIFSSPWHRLPICVQGFFAPFRMLWELCLLASFWRGPELAVSPPEKRAGIAPASIKDNVSDISSDFIAHHGFLQEFYLYPAQFYAHSAYALWLWLIAISVFIHRYGFTPRRIALLGLCYGAIATFFVIARLQLCALFMAEKQLVNRSFASHGSPLYGR